MKISSSKTLKISPLGKKLASAGLQTMGGKGFLSVGYFLRFLSTLGIKKFPYLTMGPFGNPIFLNGHIVGSIEMIQLIGSKGTQCGKSLFE